MAGRRIDGNGIHRILLYAAAGICVSCLLLSCVKEKRIECPFWLTVDLSDTERRPGSADHMEVSVVDARNRQWGDIAFTPDERGSRTFAVEKGDFEVCGLFNRHANVIGEEGRAVVIEDGQQCDSLYAFSYSGSYRGETYTVKPVIHKQWATVTLVGRLTAADERGAGVAEHTVPLQGRTVSANFYDDYGITVTGHVDGFWLSTMEGHEGPFSCRLVPDADSASFRLPRQRGNDTEDGLTVHICDRRTGEEVFSYSLSEDLRKIGFDWTLPDLSDIRLTVSMSAVDAVMIRVMEWRHEELGEITI